jgi:hypothetical protein
MDRHRHRWALATRAEPEKTGHVLMHCMPMPCDKGRDHGNGACMHGDGRRQQQQRRSEPGLAFAPAFQVGRPGGQARKGTKARHVRGPVPPTLVIFQLRAYAARRAAGRPAAPLLRLPAAACRGAVKKRWMAPSSPCVHACMESSVGRGSPGGARELKLSEQQRGNLAGSV